MVSTQFLSMTWQEIGSRAGALVGGCVDRIESVPLLYQHPLPDHIPNTWKPGLKSPELYFKVYRSFFPGPPFLGGIQHDMQTPLPEVWGAAQGAE